MDGNTNGTTDVSPPPAVPTQDQALQHNTENADALREQGNKRFAKGDFRGAEAKYTEALVNLQPNSREAAKVFGNRSLARLKSGMFDDALDDADKSIKADEKYVKAYDRKACALLALERSWEARVLYRKACEVFVDDRDILAYFKEGLESVVRGDRERDLQVHVEGMEHFKEIGRSLPLSTGLKISRLRLSTMATCWNESRPEERLELFKRFLSVLTGAEHPDPGLPLDAMEDLPMQNYADITIPENLIAFFKSLDVAGKVQAMNVLFDSCNDEEKAFISGDLKMFIPRPS